MQKTLHGDVGLPRIAGFAALGGPARGAPGRLAPDTFAAPAGLAGQTVQPLNYSCVALEPGRRQSGAAVTNLFSWAALQVARACRLNRPGLFRNTSDLDAANAGLSAAES